MEENCVSLFLSEFEMGKSHIFMVVDSRKLFPFQ